LSELVSKSSKEENVCFLALTYKKNLWDKNYLLYGTQVLKKLFHYLSKKIEHTKRDFYQTARFPAVAFKATTTSKAMATSTMELMLWVMASKISGQRVHLCWTQLGLWPMWPSLWQG